MKRKFWFIMIVLTALLLITAAAYAAAPLCMSCGEQMAFDTLSSSGYCVWVCTNNSCANKGVLTNGNNHNENCGKCPYCSIMMNKAHTKDTLIARLEPADCSSTGKYAFYICNGCGNWIIDDALCPNNGAIINKSTDLIMPAGHDYGSLIPKTTNAMCNEYNVAAHYECSRCHTLFNSEKEEVTLESLQTKGTKHSAIQHPKVAATCTTDGNVLYYTCENCDLIKTSSGKTLTSLDETIVKAAHKYGTATYVWSGTSCTATHECTACEESTEGHTETETVTGTFTADTAVSCNAPAKGHYSAVFTKAGFTTQNTEANSVENGDPAGHKYGDPTYAWNGNSCTATRTCTVCAEGINGHTETETAEGTYVKDTDATCIDPEKGHYTAAFTKNYFTAQNTEANSVEKGDPLGHKYGDPTYAWNGSSCTATRTCTVCAEGINGHTETETAEGTYVKDTDATCIDPEKGHYTATFTKEYFAAQTSEANSAENGDPLGHKYGELIPEEPATYTETGIAAHYECSECKALFDSNKIPVEEEQLIIPVKTSAIVRTPAVVESETVSKASIDIDFKELQSRTDMFTKAEQIKILAHNKASVWFVVNDVPELSEEETAAVTEKIGKAPLGVLSLNIKLMKLVGNEKPVEVTECDKLPVKLTLQPESIPAGATGILVIIEGVDEPIECDFNTETFEVTFETGVFGNITFAFI